MIKATGELYRFTVVCKDKYTYFHVKQAKKQATGWSKDVIQDLRLEPFFELATDAPVAVGLQSGVNHAGFHLDRGFGDTRKT